MIGAFAGNISLVGSLSACHFPGSQQQASFEGLPKSSQAVIRRVTEQAFGGEQFDITAPLASQRNVLANTYAINPS